MTLVIQVSFLSVLLPHLWRAGPADLLPSERCKRKNWSEKSDPNVIHAAINSKCFLFFFFLFSIFFFFFLLLLLPYVCSFFSLSKWLLKQSGAASTGSCERRTQGAQGREEEANPYLPYSALMLVLSEGTRPSASSCCTFWESNA